MCLVTQARAETPIACLIEAHRTVKLATPTPGVIARVMVDRGQAVSRGMVVAELFSAVEESELHAARLKAADDSTVRIKTAKRDVTAAKFARLRQLGGSAQFVSATAREEAEADAKAAEADLKAAQVAQQMAVNDVQLAQAKLDLRRIVAPADGIVTERTLSAGEYGYEQQAVLTMVELNPLNVEMFLPASEYGSLRIGQPVEIHPQTPIGGVYKGSVEVIDRVLDSRSGTFGVLVTLPNPDLSLPAGIRCEAKPLAE
jgi:RND family efflux transporter MFP subunit